MRFMEYLEENSLRGLEFMVNTKPEKPKQTYGTLMGFYGIETFHDVHKYWNKIDGHFYLPITTKSSVLGLLLIKGLNRISMETGGTASWKIKDPEQLKQKERVAKVIEILNAHLDDGKGDKLMDCQEELIKAGLKEYAKL